MKNKLNHKLLVALVPSVREFFNSFSLITIYSLKRSARLFHVPET